MSKGKDSQYFITTVTHSETLKDGVVGRGAGDGGDGVPQHTAECHLSFPGARGELEPHRRPVAPVWRDGAALRPDAAAGLRVVGLYAETITTSLEKRPKAAGKQVNYHTTIA